MGELFDAAVERQKLELLEKGKLDRLNAKLNALKELIRDKLIDHNQYIEMVNKVE